MTFEVFLKIGWKTSHNSGGVNVTSMGQSVNSLFLRHAPLRDSWTYWLLRIHQWKLEYVQCKSPNLFWQSPEFHGDEIPWQNVWYPPDFLSRYWCLRSLFSNLTVISVGSGSVPSLDSWACHRFQSLLTCLFPRAQMFSLGNWSGFVHSDFPEASAVWEFYLLKLIRVLNACLLSPSQKLSSSFAP